MRAIILSAGQPAGLNSPVFNFELEGSRVAEIQLSCLRACGIEDVTFVLGYRADEWTQEGVRIVRNNHWKEDGSVASLKLAGQLFDGRDDVLIAYGDTLFEPQVLRELQRSTHSFSAVCYLDRSEDDRLTFREFAHLQDGLIESITPTAASSEGIRTVFTGLVLVRRKRAEAVRRHLKEWSDRKAHVGAFVGGLVARGVDVVPISIETGWAEVTNKASLDALSQKEGSERYLVRTDWETRAKGYDRLQWVNDDALLNAIVDVAHAIGPRRCLDIGTGTGKVMLGLRTRLGHGEFWGVDSSKAMLAKIPVQPGVKVVCDDAETLTQIPTGYFDLVTARMVFHHISHPHKAAMAAVRTLTHGGHFLICEGVPPTHRAIEWYTEMFRYKEDRLTVTEGDLAHILCSAGLENVRTHSVVMKRASLNNWLNNAGLPEENVRILKDMHLNAPGYIKDDYEMEYADGDCFMTWRFAVTFGHMPKSKSKAL
jgi:ubiquinone/menaquinone biosynthesis C-methylase UbiE/choline kinase